MRTRQVEVRRRPTLAVVDPTTVKLNRLAHFIQQRPEMLRATARWPLRLEHVTTNQAFFFLATVCSDSSLTLLALRCSPALWPLVSLRKSSATGIQPQPAVLPLVAVPSASSSFRVAIGRRAFGLQFVPCCRPRRSLRCQPHSFRWNVNSGSAGRGDFSPPATPIRPAVQLEHQPKFRRA